MARKSFKSYIVSITAVNQYGESVHVLLSLRIHVLVFLFCLFFIFCRRCCCCFFFVATVDYVRSPIWFNSYLVYGLCNSCQMHSPSTIEFITPCIESDVAIRPC